MYPLALTFGRVRRRTPALAGEGWNIEQPYKGACFINKGGDRYIVTLTADKSLPPILESDVKPA
jgi:hypothetical protein